MLYDLHTHTKASDGTLTPGQLLDKAAEIDLAGVAITDHDTVSGIDEALACQHQHGFCLEVIPGIELNTENEDCEVHILGYYIDHNNSKMLKRLKELKDSRLNRAHEMIRKLKTIGFAITLEQVKCIAHDDLITRPHIAQALVDNNYVFSIREAFDKLIDRGRPAYVPRYKFHPREAIELIKSAGGIAVLAHPGLIKKPAVITQIIDHGIEGIEVYYPEHTDEQIHKLLDICFSHSLLVTGGSDFHGLGGESRDRLGSCGITSDLMEKIKKYYNKIR